LFIEEQTQALFRRAKMPDCTRPAHCSVALQGGRGAKDWRFAGCLWGSATRMAYSMYDNVLCDSPVLHHPLLDSIVQAIVLYT